MASDWWDSPELRHSLSVRLVSKDLSTPMGTLDPQEGGEVSYSYYSDTKASASLTVPADELPDTSWVRIVHVVTDESHQSHTETLGTFVARDSKESFATGGAGWRDVDLQSSLWAMAQDVDPYALTMPKGGDAKAKCQRVCADAMRPMDWTGAGARYAATSVEDAGKTRLSRLYAACTPSKQVWLQDSGRVLVRDYVAPHDRTASMVIDGRHIIDGTLSRESTRLSTPNRVIVHHRYTTDVTRNGKRQSEEHSTVGWADAKWSAGMVSSRGVRVAQFEDVDELSPNTPQAATQLARRYLDANQPGVEWTCDCTWLPVRAGDVVTLAPTGESARKCLVKTCDVHLDSWVCSLVLKEV